MNVLLIRPPRRNIYDAGLSVPPLGLAYIASSLQEQGHTVEIFRCICSSVVLVENVSTSTVHLCGCDWFHCHDTDVRHGCKALK